MFCPCARAMFTLSSLLSNICHIFKKILKIVSVLGPITTTSLIIPAAAAGPDTSNQLELESNIMIDPSCLGVPVTRRYVEDEGPEWRELDYYIEVNYQVIARTK